MYSTFWPKKWTIYIYSIVHTQSATVPAALGKQESMGGSLSGSFLAQTQNYPPESAAAE